MKQRFLILVAVLATLAACTDIVQRGPHSIAIAVPSAYKLDNAKIRADRYCEHRTGTKATLTHADDIGRTGVAYFECEG